MQAKDVIKLFDHHRHDRMNELQLLNSYASMGKINSLKEKLEECTWQAEQERRLSSLEVPETAFWVMTFNWRQTHMRMDYSIELEKEKLSVYDGLILKRSKLFLEVIESFFEQDTMYNLTFFVEKPHQTAAKASIKMSCTGVLNDPGTLAQQLGEKKEYSNITIEESENNTTICTVSWQCR